MPKISAVMALYNTPFNYLQKTIESILTQSFDDFELIIVDDASTIDYKTFFEQLKDQRIKYFKLEKNAGPGHARNEGIKKACGEYVAIVDSDDVYSKKRFEIQSAFLDKNPEISLISGAFRQSNNGKIPPVIEKDEDIKTFMLFNSPLANPLVMFRKNVFSENNLLYPEDKNFGEDYELWIEAAFKGIKIANIKDVLMTYTRRDGQLSKEKADTQSCILKDLYKKILSHIGLNASEEELELNLNINNRNFNTIKDTQIISDWFNKIIDYNKSLNFFQEETLIKKKETLIKDYNSFKNRLFKIKLGEKNLCLAKNFRIYLEDRN